MSILSCFQRRIAEAQQTLNGSQALLARASPMPAPKAAAARAPLSVSRPAAAQNQAMGRGSLLAQQEGCRENAQVQQAGVIRVEGAAVTLGQNAEAGVVRARRSRSRRPTDSRPAPAATARSSRKPGCPPHSAIAGSAASPQLQRHAAQIAQHDHQAEAAGEQASGGGAQRQLARGDPPPPRRSRPPSPATDSWRSAPRAGQAPASVEVRGGVTAAGGKAAPYRDQASRPQPASA